MTILPVPVDQTGGVVSYAVVKASVWQLPIVENNASTIFLL